MRDDHRDRRQELATGLRAAVTGRMTTWTLGRVRQLEEAVARSTAEDLAEAAQDLLMTALDARLLHSLRPSARQRLDKAARLASPPAAEPDDDDDEPIRPRRRRQDER